MASALHIVVILTFVVLVVALVLTVPAFLDFLRRITARRKHDGGEPVSKFYEDEDGVATEEALKQYSVTIPRYLALAGALIGFVVSTVLCALYEAQTTSSEHLAYWFTFGTWTLLLLQVIHTVSIQSPVKRFDFGEVSSTTSAALCASLIVAEGLRLQRSDDAGGSSVFAALDTVQVCTALITCIACLSLPRRPSLSYRDLDVDEQYTGSALGRYTFAWAEKILVRARRLSTFELVNVPHLHLQLRSHYLEQLFGRDKASDHLLKRLLLVHWREILFEYVFVVITSIIDFAQEFIMFLLLRLLERRSEVDNFHMKAWALVLGLGCAILASAWGEVWCHWIVFTRLGLPIRSELSAMIFTKAMRRNDVKGVSHDEEDAVEDSPAASETSIPAPMPGPGVIDPPDAGLQKTRQATINLVGVDAERICDSATYLYIFPLTITKMIVSIIFILKLIGWKSLFAGFSIFIIVIPINAIVSKRFSDAQGDLMEVRDRKLNVVTEALQGIRQIKFAAQEPQWQDRIHRMRAEELAVQWRVFYLDTSILAFWILGPVMLSAISLAVYTYLHGSLSPSVAFTTIAVFSSLELTMAVLPEMIADGIEAYVSVGRIDKYLKAPEKEKITTDRDYISFQNASIAWPSDDLNGNSDRFEIRDINLRFPPKQLSVILGGTGSGKSLLLAALIGEAQRLSGVITYPEPPSYSECYDRRVNRRDWILDSAVAFVAQIPWIENASIKENILFGLPFDSGRYGNVLQCCALKKDLEILPDGDQTDIGANGINLSGGQRWRVSFARALYSRAGILILDDIFSAVDAHVGRHLFEQALTGELGKGRTRILVTHHAGLSLPKANYVVILDDGKVQHAGSVKETTEAGLLSDAILEESDAPAPPAPETAEQLSRYARQSFSIENDDYDRNVLRRIVSNASQRSKSWKIDSSALDARGGNKPKKFTEEEKRETGAVKLSVYLEYIRSSGGFWVWIPILALFLGHQGVVLGKSYFISDWTRSYKTEDTLKQNFRYPLQASFHNKFATTNSSQNENLLYYVGIYAVLSIVICITGTLRYLVTYRASIKASKELFEKITFAVLRAPLRWLDTVPVGRILNRLTADFDLVDSDLASDWASFQRQMVSLVGVIIAGVIVSPWMSVAALILLGLCWRITALFLNGARNIKRLESNTKSPIFEQLGSVLAGISTIRAFGKAEEYIHRMFDRLDAHTRASWYLWLFNRWLIWRLSIVGAVFTVIVTAVIVQANIDASLAGFVLSFALQYSSELIWAAREYSDVELAMNAVERISEYSKINIEDQDEKSPVPAAWPTEGRVEVRELVTGYAPDLPPVLKGLSFSIERNQRVGVVGRTGAGKSSLTLALFRFLEARSGSIHIDGVDISKISLSTLRSRLAIIPQDPVLFSGTVRSNLDPFDNHTDAELYDALERVHLIPSRVGTGTTSRDEQQQPQQQQQPPPHEPSSSSAATHLLPPLDHPAKLAAGSINKNPFSSLSSPISESGLNLSQGQRQLLTLARAIAARPKVLIMDEATSAVDMPTDALIQRSIREEFQDATLIVIAHRLSTIADFDRVLVMQEGVGVEFGTPRELYERGGGGNGALGGEGGGRGGEGGGEGGVFRGMVDGSGEAGRLKEILGVM